MALNKKYIIALVLIAGILVLGHRGQNDRHYLDPVKKNFEAYADPVYCNLYADDVTLTTALTTSGTWYKLTDLTGLNSSAHFDTLDGSRILVKSLSGVYLVNFGTSFNGDANQTYHVALYKNSAKVPNVSMERKIGTGNDVGSASAVGLVTLAVGDTLDLRASAGANSLEININHLGFALFRLRPYWRPGVNIPGGGGY